jgi:histone H1/5
METTKKSAPKKPASTKKVAQHPAYKEMIVEALTTLHERNGSSRQKIYSYIVKNFKVSPDDDSVKRHLRTALKRMVTGSVIVQSKGVGASGSFKLPAVAKKPVAKKPAPKKAAKPVAKKTTKKPAASAKKSPAKAKAPTKKTTTAKSPKKPKSKVAKKPKAVVKKSPAKKPAKKAVKAKSPAAKKTAAKSKARK